MAASLVLTSLSPLAPLSPTTAPTAAKVTTVKVYFAVAASQALPAKVSPVKRKTSSTGVAKFAIQRLIAGPTKAERRRGLTSDLGKRIRGASDCGADFQIRISKGVATLRFCRTVWGTGVGGDATVLHQIGTTLKQFPSVKKVVPLNKDGRCLFDESTNGTSCITGHE